MNYKHRNYQRNSTPQKHAERQEGEVTRHTNRADGEQCACPTQGPRCTSRRGHCGLGWLRLGVAENAGTHSRESGVATHCSTHTLMKRYCPALDFPARPAVVWLLAGFPCDPTMARRNVRTGKARFSRLCGRSLPSVVVCIHIYKSAHQSSVHSEQTP